MTTNIVAAVVITLVTNVVPSDNAVYEPDFSVSYAVIGSNQHPMRLAKVATEKYLTTNVTEHTEVTVTLADGPHTFAVDKSISSVTAILKRLEDWKPAGVRTNEAASRTDNLFRTYSTIALTNIIFSP